MVGCIALQDLTKMGGTVRSRTYEAFFPLITELGKQGIRFRAEYSEADRGAALVVDY